MFESPMFVGLLLSLLLGVLSLRVKGLLKLALGSPLYRFLYLVAVMGVLSAAFVNVLLLTGGLYAADVWFTPFFILGMILLVDAVLHTFKRLGNFPGYIVAVYAALIFVAVMYFVEKLMLASHIMLNINRAVLMLAVGGVIAMFWLSFWFKYKARSFLLAAVAGLIVPVIKIMQGKLVFYLAPAFMLFTLVVYIYYEFVSPYPTLFDKYVFDKPRHLFWGGLMFLSFLIVVLV